MIGVLTHHWAKKGSFDQARILLDGNGTAQSKAPGFVSRTTLLSREDTQQISSLVIWESDAIYDTWKVSTERTKAMNGQKNCGRNHLYQKDLTCRNYVTPK